MKMKIDLEGKRLCCLWCREIDIWKGRERDGVVRPTSHFTEASAEEWLWYYGVTHAGGGSQAAVPERCLSHVLEEGSNKN